MASQLDGQARTQQGQHGTASGGRARGLALRRLYSSQTATVIRVPLRCKKPFALTCNCYLYFHVQALWKIICRSDFAHRTISLSLSLSLSLSFHSVVYSTIPSRSRPSSNALYRTVGWTQLSSRDPLCSVAAPWHHSLADNQRFDGWPAVHASFSRVSHPAMHTHATIKHRRRHVCTRSRTCTYHTLAHIIFSLSLSLSLSVLNECIDGSRLFLIERVLVLLCLSLGIRS